MASDSGIEKFFRENMNPFYAYRAKTVSVYDGDSVRLDIDLGFDHWQLKVPIRLWGIDTPELRGSTEEKLRGYAARDYLRSLVFDKEGQPKPLSLYSIKDKKGKYGRYLGILEVDGTIVNQALLEAGMATLYMV
jgi:micrococcal nuclease